jgi:hypothetical protein
MRALTRLADDDDGDSAAALAVRYLFLLGLGFTGLFILLLSLTAVIQIIAAGAGFDRTGIIHAGAWAMALVIAISALPLLRFSIADAPGLIMDVMRFNRRRLVVGLLIAACGFALAFI